MLWHDQFSLVFRNCEVTSGCGDMQHCPNQYCAPGAGPKDVPPVRATRSNTDAAYRTLVWTYEWPAGAEAPADSDSAAAFIASLGAAELLSEPVELALLRKLAAGDQAVAGIAAAYAGKGGGARERAARQLAALL